MREWIPVLAATVAQKEEMEVKEAVEKIPGFIRTFLEGAESFFWNLLFASIICFILKKLSKVFLRFIERVFERSKLDESVYKFLVSLIRTVIYVGLFFVFVALLNGGNFSGITAVITAIIGSAGLTLGLALQGSLQNFSGGVLILLLKPFKIGDYIIVQGYEGSVEAIDIFYTKLLTIDNRMVVLPNGTLSNTNITNVTKEDIRRLDLTVGISYNENISRVKEVIQRIIDSKELVLRDYDVNIYVNEFEASSISMGIRVWCKTENYWILRWDMLESIKNEFDKNDIVIPYNQLDVTVKHEMDSVKL